MKPKMERSHQAKLCFDKNSLSSSKDTGQWQFCCKCDLLSTKFQKELASISFFVLHLSIKKKKEVEERGVSDSEYYDNSYLYRIL